ncbi:MAG: acyltransferase [Chlorobiaceae bacterium]|jgi:peptidoglycan/LPS O-acetylase OafA/YrhL|nr:acyltransferase [Chlorobiaceae bacterium]NTV16721.1 acyltransferase [Chlorobiaceae bacterium]
MKYNRTLDGVRGLAILMVIFSHFDYGPLLHNKNMLLELFLSKLEMIGDTGVDLFFLLSGYLITTILLESKAKPVNEYLKNFYARRFLRIFPLYYLVLFFLFILLPFFIKYDQPAKQILENQLFVWLYLSNLPGIVINWDSSSLFWLGHFWSLAVEEQFYLIWPLIVYFSDNKSLKFISTFLILLSVFSITIYSFNSDLNFFEWRTVSRGGGLCVGSLIAIFSYEKNDFKSINGNQFLFIVSLLIYVVVLCSPRLSFFHAHIHYAAWFFYAVCFVFLINLKSGLLYKILTSKILVFLGVISYGLYVYHEVLRPRVYFYIKSVFASYSTGFVFFDLFIYSILVLVFYVIIAALSYYFYEKFFLKMKKYF